MTALICLVRKFLLQNYGYKYAYFIKKLNVFNHNSNKTLYSLYILTDYCVDNKTHQVPVYEYLFHLFRTKAKVVAYAHVSIQNNILEGGNNIFHNKKLCLKNIFFCL